MSWFAKKEFDGEGEPEKRENSFNRIITRCRYLRFSLNIAIGLFIFLLFRIIIFHTDFEVKLGQQIYLNGSKNVNIERTIDVVMGSDDEYAQPSAATIASILLNCDTSSRFRFHILDGGISAEKKEKLKKLKELRNFEIKFYDMTKYAWSIFPNNREHVTLATYYRLRIPEVLPKDIQKVLYLDGDVIVEQDLKELWDTDISDYVLGAVKEGIELGVRHDFNAGVLLLNLDKLRKINLLKDSLSYLEKNRGKIVYQDQDILNGLFFNQYKDLSRKWNVTSNIYMPRNSSLVYANKEAEIARKNPGIIHFSGGGFKPWNQEMLHPLSYEYWNYYKYTDFYSPEQRKSPIFRLILLHISLIKQTLNSVLNKFY